MNIFYSRSSKQHANREDKNVRNYLRNSDLLCETIRDMRKVLGHGHGHVRAPNHPPLVGLDSWYRMLATCDAKQIFFAVQKLQMEKMAITYFASDCFQIQQDTFGNIM